MAVTKIWNIKGSKILPPSHSPSVEASFSAGEPSQAMGAVSRNPAKGGTPVERFN
jgi:hypothetical protein